MSPPKDPLSPAPLEQPYTALQSHVSFFDSDRDDIIWPKDTYNGCRALGFNILFSVLQTLIIHVTLSYLTFGTWLPDPYFRLRVSLMHRAKHGSDSNSYTYKGEFDRKRFDEIFTSYSAPPHTSMSFLEGVRMIHGNRNPFDPFGWTAAMLEWGTLYILVWPKDRRVSKEEVRGVLDGTLFQKIAKANSNKHREPVEGFTHREASE